MSPDRKLTLLAGIIRGIMELCMSALAVLEPDAETDDGQERKPSYFGEDDPN